MMKRQNTGKEAIKITTHLLGSLIGLGLVSLVSCTPTGPSFDDGDSGLWTTDPSIESYDACNEYGLNSQTYEYKWDESSSTCWKAYRGSSSSMINLPAPPTPRTPKPAEPPTPSEPSPIPPLGDVIPA